MEIKPTQMTTRILTTVINEKPQAFAYIMGENIEGTVCFYPYRKGTIMIYEIRGLPKNELFFACHIHVGQSCQNPNGHFNPYHKEHPYHLGDLPPLYASQGIAWGMLYIDRFKPEAIIHHTFIIHEHADDFQSQPSGNSGKIIACGEIEYFMK